MECGEFFNTVQKFSSDICTLNSNPRPFVFSNLGLATNIVGLSDERSVHSALWWVASNSLPGGKLFCQVIEVAHIIQDLVHCRLPPFYFSSAFVLFRRTRVHRNDRTILTTTQISEDFG